MLCDKCGVEAIQNNGLCFRCIFTANKKERERAKRAVSKYMRRNDSKLHKLIDYMGLWS